MPSDERMPVRVLVFGAALRRESLNDRLATLAASVVQKAGGEVDRAHLTDFLCPFYDQDIETEQGIPEGAVRFRERLLEADGFIISSPEYNASIPAALKNTIDWVSRFRPQPLKGKQGLLVSASPSMAGGNRGLWGLRVPLEHLGARVYPDMFSLAQAHEAFDENGEISNEVLRKFFQSTVSCFLDLVEAAKHYPKIKTQWIEFLGERPNKATERVETSEEAA